MVTMPDTSSPMTSPAAQLKLVGGIPCLDFVNTVGSRVPSRDAAIRRGESLGLEIVDEKLSTYDDLLSWSRHAGLLPDTVVRRLVAGARHSPRESAAVLKRAVAFREVLHRIFIDLLHGRSPSRDDTDLLNREISIARSHQRLSAATQGYAWMWDTDAALDNMLWVVADSAARLVTSANLPRLRQCAGHRCGWLFVDSTRNGSRHWCDMKDCGNAAKVRRFRQRARAKKKS